MAFERNFGLLAEPEVVYDGGLSVPDLGGWSLQNYQNQFMQDRPFNAALATAALQQQPQYSAPEPVYQQPTYQPVQTASYTPAATPLAVTTPAAAKPLAVATPAAKPLAVAPAPKPAPVAKVKKPKKVKSVAAAVPEPTYSQPTAQPVQSAPYYEEPSYQPTTAASLGGESPAETYSFNVMSNKNKPTGSVNVAPTTSVMLYDKNSKRTIDVGTGVDAARKIEQLAAELTSSQGKKADWVIYTYNPGEVNSKGVPAFTKVAKDPKDTNLLGTIANIALPALGSVLLPGVGGVVGALGRTGAAAAGSALGSALSGALQGKSALDILKNAALSGGLTYAGGSLLGGKAPASSGGSAFDAAFSPEYSSWLSSGSTAAAPAIAGAGGGGLGGFGGSIAGADDLGNFIQVAGKLPASNLTGALAAASAAPGLVNYGSQLWGNQPSESEVPEGSDNGWTVEAPRENVITPPPASLPIIVPPLNSVDIPPLAGTEYPPIEAPVEENEGAGWTVEAPTRPGGGALPVTLPPPPLNSVDIPPLADTKYPTTETKKPGLGVEDYLKIAGLLASALGGSGSKGNSNLGALAGMRGALNPIFSAQLPPPNMQAAIARPMSGIDWYRYGYGPEQSFFTNVPQGAANTSTAYTGYEGGLAALIEKMREAGLLPGYAAGGYAVGGPGDGREDKIPAMLSDGEYVMDAETVAMLGNGSSKAGADALDKFRVNIRKHKGRKLSKGEFSVDAKKPEQYLKGHK